MDLLTPILTVSLTLLSLVAGWYVVKPRLFAQINQFLGAYIENTIKNIVEHPESVKPLMDALVQAGMRSAGIDKEKNLPGLKIGGLKIPGYLVQAAMPFIQNVIGKNLPQAAQSVAENALA